MKPLSGKRYRYCIMIDRLNIPALASIARFFLWLLGWWGIMLKGEVTEESRTEMIHTLSEKISQ
jgi:hypothetical protein